MAKQMRYASRESVAYQDETYRVPRAVKQPPLRVVKTQGHRRVLRAQNVFCILFCVAVAGVMLYSQAVLTDLTREVSTQAASFEQMQNEYISLRAQQDKALGLSFVEEYAQNKLGMVKLDNNAVEYVEMDNPDRIEVTKTTPSMGGAFSGLVKSFSSILEYMG